MDQKNPRLFGSIVVVAVLTLIQGIVYFGLAVWCFFVYRNNCGSSTINLGLIMYFSYFPGSKCDEISVGGVNVFRQVFPEEISVAKRTYFIIIAYGVISALWILTSLAALVGSFCSAKGKRAFHACFSPWFLCVLLGSILDVVATIFNVIDVMNTRTVTKTLEHMEAKRASDIEAAGNISKDYLYLPIIFACITARLIIFWLINVVGVFLAIRYAKKIVLNKSKNSPSNSYNEQPPIYPDNNADRQNGKGVTTNGVDAYSFVPPQKNFRRNERRTFEPLKSGSPTLSDSRNPELDRYQDVSNRNYDKFQRYDRDEHSNYPQQTGRDSPISYQHSIQNSAGPGNETPLKELPKDVHVSDELRSQLPWSYFNFRDDIISRRKALNHVQDHEVLPPVPVPDYTLHFPKKERPSMIGENVVQRQVSTSSQTTRPHRSTQSAIYS